MAKQVETRVVEMEFKNKDFEKAVSVTMESLEELNKKIEDLNNINTQGFEKLSQVANSVKFDALFDNIDRLQDRLTTLGGKFVSRIQDEIVNIGINAFQSATNGLERAYDNVTSTIVNKGKVRAQNLAQAKFQLEALGVEWNKIYDDMDYAVTGTAYGIDEAARAASQFAASNVALGDDMKAALRGISGVAAMTGRGYSEIAQIFTTVAGTGRAMNSELNRIAERGLNAKKAIADYINKVNYFGDGIKVTQEEIFDFAKDSKISFDLFSKAMDDAFGEHSTKANELFTGALDNTKAALGRIGERFATPIYEDLRQILVALIPVINDFKKSLDPIVNSATAVTGSVRKLIVNGLEKLHGAFLKEDAFTFDFFGNVVDAKEILTNILNDIGDLIGGVDVGINAEPFLNILWNIIGVLKAIKQGFVDVFGAPTRGDIIYIMQSIQYLTDKLRLSEETLDKLKSTLRGVFSLIDIVLKTANAVFQVFVMPLLRSLGWVDDTILDLTGDIGDMLYEFDQGYYPLEKLSDAFEILKARLRPVTNALKEFFKFVSEGFTKLTGIHNLEEFFGALESAAEKLHLADIFYAIAGGIMFAIDKLVEFKDKMESDSSFKEYLKGLVEQNSVLTWLRDTLEKIKTTVKDLWAGRITLSQALGLDKLAEQFPLINEAIEKFKEHYKSIFEAYEGEEGKNGLPFIQQFGDRLKEAIKNLTWEDIFGAIGAGFYAYWMKKSVDIQAYVAETFGKFHDTFQKLADGVTMSLGKMTKETNAEKILKIAAGIALLSASVLLLGKMNPDDIKQGIGYLFILMGAITIMVGLLGKVMKTTEKLEDDYHIYKEGIKDKNNKKSIFTLGKKSIFEAITEKVSASLTDGTKKIEKTIKDLSAVPALILSLGVSIALITSSLTKLFKVTSDISYKKLLTVGVMFFAIFASLGAVVFVIAKYVTEHKEDLNEATINALAKMFLFFGIAIKLISGAIGTLAIISHFAGIDNLLVAAGTIAAIIGFMALICDRLVEVSSKNHGGYKNILSAGGVMMMMAAAIQMLVIPIAALSALIAIPQVGLDKVQSASRIILAMIAVMAAVAVGIAKFTEGVGIAGVLAGSASMLIMAAAINAMIIPLAAITALVYACKNGELMDALSTISLLMAVMTGVLALFGIVGGYSAGLGSVGMLAGAASMILIAKALTAMLVPLAGIMVLSKQGDIYDAFKKIALGLGILTIAGIAVIAISPALLVLASVLVSLGGAVLFFGQGIKGIGQGVLAFVSALALLQTINFENMSVKIAEAISAIIDGVRTAMNAGRPQIEEGFFTLLAAGCSVLVSSTAMIAEACLKLLADVIIAIDNHSKELGFGLGHALLNIILYAIAGVVAAGLDFVGMLFGLEEGEGFTTLFKKRMLEGKKDNISEAEAKEMTMDFGHKLGDALTNNFLDGFRNSLENKKIDFKELFTNYVGALNTTEIANSFLTGGLSGGFRTASTSIGAHIMGSMFKKQPGDQQALQEATKDTADDTVDSMASNIESTENTDKVSDSVNTLMEKGFEKVDTSIANGSFEDMGNQGIDTLANTWGLEGDNFKVFSDFGENIPESIGTGIENNSKAVNDALSNLGGDTVKSFHDGEWSFGSPSKTAILFGKWIDEGLAEGITGSSYSDKALTEKTSGLIGMFASIGDLASEATNGSALDNLRSAIASLAEAANGDLDYTPTITPVLDMSNVNAGFASLSEMFSRNQSIALATDALSMNSANRNLTMEIQNDNNTRAIESLGAKLDRLGEAFMNTQMVMDTGEVVGVMANPMDRELGRKAIQVQRGGARR